MIGTAARTVLVVLLLLLPCPAQAHPHVWVDVSLAFSVSDEGLEHVRETWLFDEMFTNAIMSDLDLTPASLETFLGREKIRRGAFDFLANYGYFTHVEFNGEPHPVEEVLDFEAHYFDGRLVYGFTVPIHRPFRELSGFRIAVFDREYYADVQLIRDAIGFEIGGMVSTSHDVRPAEDLAYWKFIVPDAVHLSLSGPSGRTAELPVASRPVKSSGLAVEAMNRVRALQKSLTLRLNRFGMDIRDNPASGALWLFLGLSFLYGVVHAVGPGHGKSVACSYFMANPGSLISAAVMANAITFVHMLSAVVVVAAAYLVLGAGMGGFQRVGNVVQPLSYGLLACAGLFLSGRALRRLLRGGAGEIAACPGPEDVQGSPGTVGGMLAVSFVTGLIPCPGAAVILSFSIGLDILWAGVLAVTAMAAGMGVTTTAFVWAALGARRTVLAVSGRNRGAAVLASSILSLAGALAIACLGGLLFYTSLGNRWPGF